MPDGRDEAADLLIDRNRNSTHMITSTFTDDSPVTMVPVKPTAEMLAAGTRAGEVSVEIAWRVYQAMVTIDRRDGDPTAARR